MSAGLAKYAAEIALEAAAHVHQLDPALLKSLAWLESSWNAHAVSSVGAQGLCQLMPATADELGVAHPLDALENALAGAAYLRGLLTHYQGDLRLALCAYNWGRGHVDRARAAGVPFPVEVERYARAVVEHQELFAAKGQLLSFEQPKPEGAA